MRNLSHVLAHTVCSALAFMTVVLVTCTIDARKAPGAAGALLLLTLGMGTTSLIQAAAADR